MGQNPNPHPINERRTLFTKDARLTVTRFDKAGAAAGTAQGVKLTGYALLWNVLSDDRGGYKVRLLPGSAKFSDPTMALFHHDFAAVIGNTQNGTLRLTPDDTGVKVEIDLPDTTMGNDVAELVDKGYVQGMSFAMVDAPKFAMKTEGKQQVMEVSAFDADEVTVTAIPAFSGTSIEVAESADEGKEPEPDAQRIAASKKSSKIVNPLVTQRLNIERYKLAALGRDSGDWQEISTTP